jgi:erythromycin esterase
MLMFKQVFFVFLSMLLMACNVGISSSGENKSTSTVKENGDVNFHQTIIANSVAVSASGGELSKDDLALFAQSIADTRIVALGEQTHGAGSVFTLKAQLIKYLHEHHDFDLFILESGLFDVNEIWQQAQRGQRIKDIAPGNIFYMYSKTDEVTPLFDYINEQALTDDPLMLVGFDSQHSGGISNQGLVQSLTGAVKQIKSASFDNWTQTKAWLLFAEQLQQVLNTSQTRFVSETENLFFTQLNRLQAQFLLESRLKQPNDEIDYDFWYRIVMGLEAQAKRQWKIADNRSKEMGENIKYWAEKYPNKKIIVWAHTWHLTRDGNYQVNAGQVVSEAYGQQYFMIHFTGASGEYLDFVDMKNKPISTPTENSIETVLNQKISTNIAFTDVRELNRIKPQTQSEDTLVFANDYRTTIKADQWPKFWDGIFFIKNIEPATYVEQ